MGWNRTFMTFPHGNSLTFGYLKNNDLKVLIIFFNDYKIFFKQLFSYKILIE